MGAYPVLNLKQIRKNKYKRMNDFITKQDYPEKQLKEQKVDSIRYLTIVLKK